jgi:hypothetical protein
VYGNEEQMSATRASAGKKDEVRRKVTKDREDEGTV